MTPEQVQRAVKKNRAYIVEVFTASLQESYPHTKAESVEAAIASWERKEPPQGIIELFVHGWLNTGTSAHA
ncbi:MAG: hypothetical protein Q8R28_11120 [Dehalococcoidia bacterium]|nr:hypothetical protein [Dehalococcoidia bacterium]